MDLSKSRGISLDLAETHSAYVKWYGENFAGTEVIIAESRQDMEDSVIFWLGNNYKHAPFQWLATETAVMIRNAKRYGELCRMLGSVERWCRQHNVKYFEGSTAEIDSASVIPHCKRDERKQHTRAVAMNLWPSSLGPNEDQCDAIVTGIWGWGKFKELMWSEEAT